MESIGKLIEQTGLPFGLLIMVVLAIWNIGRYVSKRCFNPQDGIVTQLVSKHNEMIESTRQTQARICKIQESLEDTARMTAERVGTMESCGITTVSTLRELLRSARDTLPHVGLPEEVKVKLKADLETAIQDLSHVRS